jgi:uncharacterized membrane protein YhhN
MINLSRKIIFIYFLVAILEFAGDILGFDILIFVFKPLLMPLLFIAYYPVYKIQNSNFSKIILLSLVFSFFGDITLMLIEYNEHLFIIGLASFLIAHLLYIISFYKNIKPFTIKLLKRNILYFLIFIAFYTSLLFVLWGNLNEMLIPVLIYGAVITLMGVFATLRKTNKESYVLVLLGALLFICSDTLIAFNKFIFNSDLLYAQAYIMILYVLAQYFIIRGISKA